MRINSNQGWCGTPPVHSTPKSRVQRLVDLFDRGGPSTKAPKLEREAVPVREGHVRRVLKLYNRIFG